ncbi:uncharacterized protein C2845_PM11G27880 [Panicum miliaceum]|uniref:Xaa-Pro dipeptidyl-peptidase-like domain-containing protein n=1 Tax=Panicum miliaceum TaxID=4540 RepID=A0A3L6RT88_PANMI|nr:uncharacterized protein C2845_PM11G27880 [Panicum miliaceum]
MSRRSSAATGHYTTGVRPDPSCGPADRSTRDRQGRDFAELTEVDWASEMEWPTVETGDGAKLRVRVFKAPASREEPEAAGDVAVVMVHPYTKLGGSQGLLRGMAEGVARRGYTAVTFDMRGAGRSTGRASLTGSTEVGDIAAVCRWVAENIKPRGILLVGSSAGEK